MGEFCWFLHVILMNEIDNLRGRFTLGINVSWRNWTTDLDGVHSGNELYLSRYRAHLVRGTTLSLRLWTFRL